VIKMETPTVLEPVEVRNFIHPFLDFDDFDEDTLIERITTYENLLGEQYFDGSLPTSAKYGLKLIVASDILRDPSIANDDAYGRIKKIGDLTFQSEGADKYIENLSMEWKLRGERYLKKLAYKKVFRIGKTNE